MLFPRMKFKFQFIIFLMKVIKTAETSGYIIFVKIFLNIFLNIILLEESRKREKLVD